MNFIEISSDVMSPRLAKLMDLADENLVLIGYGVMVSNQWTTQGIARKK